MNRRHFLVQTACIVGVAKYSAMPATAAVLSSSAQFEVFRTKEQWQARLTDFEYQVMREEKTERAGSMHCLMKNAQVLITAKAATYLCTLVAPNMRAEQAGQVFIRAYRIQSERKRIMVSLLPVRKCIAVDVEVILAISLTMALNLQGYVTV